MILEYNGTRYSGWQKQHNSKSIQESIILAVKKVLEQTKGEGKFIDLQGSGRTDAGVHAYEQVAHLDCETTLAPEILRMKINDELSSDINILQIDKIRNKLRYTIFIQLGRFICFSFLTNIQHLKGNVNKTIQ